MSQFFVCTKTSCSVCGGGRYQPSGNTPDVKCIACNINEFLLDDKDNVDYHDAENDCVKCPK